MQKDLNSYKLINTEKSETWINTEIKITFLFMIYYAKTFILLLIFHFA